ncbi:thioredoxin-like domain-containing protein [Acidicapsa ligni]|uniref:thioredoxin-like domain-containing protein n=1 Tax=Acidicapsa ligni TaxID=542300 RepID=UPI0021DFEF80|nr:thioredoxin-like domain-containing protein [Acidicapsa ligni]
MYRIASLALLLTAAFPSLVFAQSATALTSNTAPADSKAGKTFARAAKEFEDRKYGLASADFRKADQLDGGHCVSCQLQAYKSAKLMGDFTTAHDEATLLMNSVVTPEDKAEVHYLIGDVCLAEGGDRIFDKPFQDAESEFHAALELQPEKPNCVYGDGLALAHLHQYEKARERFKQYMKLSSPTDLQYAHAKLFAVQPELARKRVAPNFHVVAMDGSPIAMESLAGKVILIDFWATWCAPCMKALPHLREIAEEFKGQPLVVISVSVDNDESTWKNFVAKNNMTWLQYRDGGFDGPIATAFNVKAIPTTFTVDTDGFVQDRQVGDGDIETTLKRLVTQASDAANHKTLAEIR